MRDDFGNLTRINPVIKRQAKIMRHLNRLVARGDGYDATAQWI
jgi:hypothetical protein